MSLDKFGHYSHKTNAVNVRGLKGEGFKLNSEGNYDIENKKLCNVLDPSVDDDAVNLKTLNKYVSDTLRLDAGNYNAKSIRITGVADAISDSDVVNLRYFKKHTISTDKKNAFDAKNTIITNVGIPVSDSDAVNLRFLKNHALFLNKEIDAKKRVIKNLARPQDPHDAVNYMYMMEVLATLSYTIYLKLNENKKKKFTKLEWATQVMTNLDDWDQLFEATY